MKMNVTTPRTQYDGLRMSTTKFVLLFAIFLDFFLQFKQNTVSVSISAFVQIITSKAYVLVRKYMNDRSTDPSWLWSTIDIHTWETLKRLRAKKYHHHQRRTLTIEPAVRVRFFVLNKHANNANEPTKTDDTTAHKELRFVNNIN